MSPISTATRYNQPTKSQKIKRFCEFELDRFGSCRREFRYRTDIVGCLRAAHCAVELWKERQWCANCMPIGKMTRPAEHSIETELERAEGIGYITRTVKTF